MWRGDPVGGVAAMFLPLRLMGGRLGRRVHEFAMTIACRRRKRDRLASCRKAIRFVPGATGVAYRADMLCMTCAGPMRIRALYPGD
jgi:hypothetical protein